MIRLLFSHGNLGERWSGRIENSILVTLCFVIIYLATKTKVGCANKEDDEQDLGIQNTK